MAWKPWLVVPRFIVPEVEEYEWSLSGPTEVDEGEDIDWTLTVDLNGLTPVEGEIINVSFRGQAIPLLGGTFVHSIGEALSNACADTPGATKGVDLNVLFDMNVWDGTFVFTRGTVNKPEEQGNQTCSIEIYNITKGAIVVGTVEVDIIDLPPSAPEGTELADFTIDVAVTRGGVPTLYCLTGAAQGVVLGVVSEVTGDLDSVEFVTGGDNGGRFQLDGFNLEVGPTVPDFEAVPGQIGVGYGVPFYFVTLRGHGPNASVVDKQFRIGAESQLVAPTGDGTDTITQVSDLNALRTQVRSTSSNRTTKIAEVPTIYEMGGNSNTLINRLNYTLEGYFRAVALKDYAIGISGGGNIKIRNLVAKPGIDSAGQNYENRDALQVSHSGLLVTDVIFENCEFSLSTDEIVSIISGSGLYVRNLLFRYCAFYEAAAEPSGSPTPLHPEGAHNFGPLVYNGQQNVVFDRCLLVGFNQRNIAAAKARQILMQNCLVYYRGNSGGFGGTLFYSTNASVENNMQQTGIVRGNLYFPHPGQSRDRALMFSRVGPGSYVHFVQADDVDSIDYPNHFHNPVTLDFGNDPVLRASHLKLNNGSSALSAIDYDPFKPADYDPFLTTSSGERAALWEDVWFKAGAHPLDEDGLIIPGVVNKQLYDCLTQLRTDGNPRTLNIANINTWYGSDWNVGGTKGKINDEAELDAVSLYSPSLDFSDPRNSQYIGLI